MSKLLVFGHQNPDTDAITSAISYAFLLRQLGEDAEAVALGTPNEETQYALNYFKKEAPRVIGDVSPYCKFPNSKSFILSCRTCWMYEYYFVQNV